LLYLIVARRLFRLRRCTSAIWTIHCDLSILGNPDHHCEEIRMLPNTDIPRSSNFPSVKEIAETFEKKAFSTKPDDNAGKLILHHDNNKLQNNTKLNDN